MDGVASSSSAILLPWEPRNSRPNLSDQDWEMQRPTIEQLYSSEKKKLQELMQIMRDNHGFTATESQYKKRIQKWRLGRNVKDHEKAFIAQRLEKRQAEGKSSTVLVRGQDVGGKMERWITRNNSVGNAPLSQPSPAAATPPDIRIFTPSPANMQPSVQSPVPPSAPASSPRPGWYPDFMTSPATETLTEVHLRSLSPSQPNPPLPTSPPAWQDDVTMLLNNFEVFPPLSPLNSEQVRLPSVSRSQSVERPEHRGLSEEKIQMHFTLIRECVDLGHQKAGMEIFLNLCKMIDALGFSNWSPISREIKRKYEGLGEEAILAHVHQIISELEAEDHPDHAVLLDFCSLVSILYFVPEILVPGKDRKDLTDAEFPIRIDKGKRLLERVLKQGLDDETVKKLLDATSFYESLPSGGDATGGVLEKLILQGARQPFLAHACGALSHYYDLRSRYAFSIALYWMIDKFIATRRITELPQYLEILKQMGWIIPYERESGEGTLYITEKAHWPPRPEDEAFCQPPLPEDETMYDPLDEVGLESEEL